MFRLDDAAEERPSFTDAIPVAVQASFGTTLHAAAAVGNADAVGGLLKAAPGFVRETDSLGQTPLHRAIDGGHVELVAPLVAAGADVNAQDCLRRTPLHLATIRGLVAGVDKLMQAGADGTIRDDRGRTPRDLADAGVMFPLAQHAGSDTTVRELVSRLPQVAPPTPVAPPKTVPAGQPVSAALLPSPSRPGSASPAAAAAATGSYSNASASNNRDVMNEEYKDPVERVMASAPLPSPTPSHQPLPQALDRAVLASHAPGAALSPVSRVFATIGVASSSPSDSEASANAPAAQSPAVVATVLSQSSASSPVAAKTFGRRPPPDHPPEADSPLKPASAPSSSSDDAPSAPASDTGLQATRGTTHAKSGRWMKTPSPHARHQADGQTAQAGANPDAEPVVARPDSEIGLPTGGRPQSVDPHAAASAGTSLPTPEPSSLQGRLTDVLAPDRPPRSPRKLSAGVDTYSRRPEDMPTTKTKQLPGRSISAVERPHTAQPLSPSAYT